MKNIFTLLILCICNSFLIAQIYVDIDAIGNNDGTSWENAYTNLRNAINNAEPGVQIWVAEGTYTPADANGDRTYTFFMKNGFQVYGGFQGNETSINQRDWLAHPTILSGDLNGDDNENIDFSESTRSENSYSVVTIKGEDGIILNGFIIEGGNSNDFNAGTEGLTGAGIYMENPYYNFVINDIHIANCIIRKNTASNSAAATVLRGSNNLCSIDAHFYNCTIENNSSPTGTVNSSYTVSGTPMALGSFTEIYFVNCLINNNEGQNYGNSFYLSSPEFSGSQLKFYNSTVVDNIGGNGLILADEGLQGSIRVDAYNSIIWNNGNKVVEIVNQNPIVTINHSATNGIYDVVPTEINHLIPSDPMFSDATNGDYSLSNCSSLIDEGNDDYNLNGFTFYTNDLDLAENTRISGLGLDLGAYELQFPNATSISEILCDGDSYDFYGNILTEAGSYGEYETDGNGCVINFHSLILTDGGTLTGTLNAENTNICEGEEIILTSSGGDVYSWSTGENTSSIVVNPSSTSIYTVTITNALGCAKELEIEIIVNALPEPIIIQTDNELSTGIYDSYQWYDELGNAISNATNSSFSPSTSGNYYVLVTNIDGCQGISDLFNFLHTSNNNIESQNFNIYPNPANNIIYIESLWEENTQLQISNTQGQLIKQIEINNTNRCELDVQTFNSGIYLLQFTTDKKTYTHKIIIQ